MKEIILYRGQIALIDNEDYELVSKRSWYLSNNNYVVSGYKLPSGKWSLILMHRLILSAGNGEFIDHINGNTLDNRKINLRKCTLAQNQGNRKMSKKSSSGFKGVYKMGSGRYKARITCRGVKIYIGSFDSDIDAAIAYDKKAIDLFGEFACINFPAKNKRKAS